MNKNDKYANASAQMTELFLHQERHKKDPDIVKISTNYMPVNTVNICVCVLVVGVLVHVFGAVLLGFYFKSKCRVIKREFVCVWGGGSISC